MATKKKARKKRHDRRGKRVSLYFMERDLHLYEWAREQAEDNRQTLSAFIAETLEQRMEGEDA
jgi:hypothetical protein